MHSTKSPLQWRVLAGWIAGLVGVSVIGAALAFPGDHRTGSTGCTADILVAQPTTP